WAPISIRQSMVPGGGFEPPIHGFTVRDGVPTNVSHCPQLNKRNDARSIGVCGCFMLFTYIGIEKGFKVRRAGMPAFIFSDPDKSRNMCSQRTEFLLYRGS